MLIKRILGFALFLVLGLLLIELSFRIYVSGPMALNPARFNSMNLILTSGLVEKSPYPEVFYQLKPDLDSWFRGVRLHTNSHGLVDKEYELAKPADTYRVAVVGSSWTMATGVEVDDSFHALLEDELNKERPDQPVEFVNFATELYGLREIVGTARHRVPEWQPDAIVMAITSYTAYLRWEEPDPAAELPATTYPFLQSWVFRTLDRKFGLGNSGWGVPTWGVPGRPTLRPEEANDGTYAGQIERSMREIAAIGAELDVPVIVMWLSFGHPGPEIEPMMLATAEELGLIYLPGYTVFSRPGFEAQHHQSGRFSQHPSPTAHKYLAEDLKETMLENNLLSGT